MKNVKTEKKEKQKYQEHISAKIKKIEK